MKHTAEEIEEMARDNVEKYFGKDSKQVSFMGLPDLTILVIELLDRVEKLEKVLGDK